MKSRFISGIILSIIAAAFLAGCKHDNIVSTEAPVSAVITGVVVGSSSPAPLGGVTVILTRGSTSDSIVTGSDGMFQFILDLPDSNGVDVTLTFHKTGYLPKTVTTRVKGDLSYPVGLDIDPAAYSVVSGVVRDSASAYPIGGASVLISLPATASSTTMLISKMKARGYKVTSFVVDSTSTLLDGSFIMNVNLFDLDSIAATMTISKPGFKTYQINHTFTRGPNAFGTVPLVIDNSLSFAHITGRIVDRSSGLPIRNVSVFLATSLKSDSTFSLTDGSYSFDMNLQGLSSISGTLAFRLTSYRDTTLSFSAGAGQTISRDVTLTPEVSIVGGDSSTGRGIARSISLVSVSRQEISVHGVGKNETSVLTWQVLDSLGFPIDISHRDTVTFEPTGIPVTMGGAYVTPSSGVTDGSGKVSTTVNSGTVAGTIQLVTSLRLSSGAIVQSSPVPITVDGGLPDQAHFELNSATPHALNFAGYDWSEITQGFTAQAGDKYGNPVAPGTAIYFSTTAGIITAAGHTSSDGHASAILYSGYPLPKLSGLDSTYFGDGTGYAYVKAFTQGEGGAIVADSGLICISASTAPILFNDSTSISTVIITSGSSVSIPVHISDRFGNPLESGTTITATVSVVPPPPNSGYTWSVNADGLPATLDDYLTRGPGSTDFTLIVSGSAVPTTALTTPLAFTVTVTVSGRNGKRSGTFAGRLTP